jgi:hypothetical protein
MGVLAEAFYAVVFWERPAKTVPKGGPWLTTSFDATKDAALAQFTAEVKRRVKANIKRAAKGSK